MPYKHTQTSYMMIAITMAILLYFLRIYNSATMEPVSPDSGTNLLVTSVMVLIVLVVASFVSLHVTVDEKLIHIKFGYGLFSKKIPLQDIQSVKAVRNKWYYGRGIRVWFWPYMWIYNVAGLDAVELQMKNGKIYRIGTDQSDKLLQALHHAIAVF